MTANYRNILQIQKIIIIVYYVIPSHKANDKNVLMLDTKKLLSF